MARGRSNSSSRTSEIVGLVAFALAALLAISLFTFDPLDRSFFTAPPSSRGPTRNLAGAVGANLAYGLLVLLGVLAYLAPAALVAFGVRRLRTTPSRPRPTLVVAALVLWLSLAALLALGLRDVHFSGSDGTVLRSVPVPAGGIAGQAVASGLVRLAGPAGSLIVLLTVFAGSLVLTTPLSLTRILDATLDRVRSVGTALTSALKARLARRRRVALDEVEARYRASRQAVRPAAEASRKAAPAERDRRPADDVPLRDRDDAATRLERDRLELRAATERDKLAAREAAERDKLEARAGLEREKREAREAAESSRREARERAEREEREAREAAEAEHEALEAARAAADALRVEAEREQERAVAEAVARAAIARRTAREAERFDGNPARLAPAVPQPAQAAAPEPALAAALSRASAATTQATASRPLAREQAARAAAATLKLEPAREPVAMASATAPAAAEPAPPAPLERLRGTEIPATGHTPRDVAALAAEASDALRKARAEKMEADLRRRPTGPKAAIVEDFALPPLSLLETLTNDAVVTERELVENAKVLVSKLNEFAVDGTVQAINPGPVVTTYEYRPEAGVKYSKIVGLADDLCLAMKAEGVRIDRISGKSAVGIEVPNSVRETIGLREMLESEAFQKSTSKLTLTLGKGISGEPYITDLRKMPHLLIAGATGSGKSVAVNCMIVSVLYKATPEEVKFIMVDPKRIELGVYDGIPHLLVPVVTDCRLASNALRWAVVEMENRYKKLASLGVRSLEQYNSYVRGPDAKRLAENATAAELAPLPYIVILIDELADLMMVAANDVEDSISRLAAMARAVGIHLVLATQRPSVDVITGVIKANFPSRISFRVSSKVDSRTILDSNGAEMLLGKGDMLFMPPGSARLHRVHGAFISDGEVQRLVNYLKNQRDPEYNDQVLATAAPEKDDEFEGEMDEMYDEAVRVVLETGQASVSHLQRRLRLGYSRAARLVDIMELNGIVGPSQGAKGREILVDRAQYLSQL